MKTKLYLFAVLLFLFSCYQNTETFIPEKLEQTKVERQKGVNNMRGFNWADARDNFVDGWVIPSGLTSDDNYATVRNIANDILSAFQNVGANTVRLPINPSSVSDSWWANYKGAIDEARSMGMMVILCYWEAASSKDGLVDDLNLFWEMWDQVVSDYNGDSGVHFEVFNEPHGYSKNDLIALYSDWLNRYPSVPRGRIMLGGTGYSERVSEVGGVFPDCLLSQHIYAWWGQHTSTSAWESEIAGRIGDYASRTVITEFGVTMTTGKNYSGSIDGDYEIAFLKGITRYSNKNNVASVYWPGLRDGDSYSLYTHNSGTMTLTNSSGLEPVQYAWGIGETQISDYKIINRNSGKLLDVNGASIPSTKSK
ncbi:MAG: cellulase family glycosylhydrolase [Hormoscilla sp.]